MAHEYRYIICKYEKSSDPVSDVKIWKAYYYWIWMFVVIIGKVVETRTNVVRGIDSYVHRDMFISNSAL